MRKNIKSFLDAAGVKPQGFLHSMKRKLSSFLGSIDPFDEEGGDISAKITNIPNSAFQFSPGDILAFTYPGSQEPYKIALIVSTKRGDGTFISTKGNHLITAYDLDIAPSFLPILVKTLHNNRGRASYGWIESQLGVILGRTNFRTYNLAKCSRIKKIRINTREI